MQKLALIALVSLTACGSPQEGTVPQDVLRYSNGDGGETAVKSVAFDQCVASLGGKDHMETELYDGTVSVTCTPANQMVVIRTPK